MTDWDDIRFFLAIAREGSVRAAAERLKVNHSTVLRRISLLEERLGAHVFERLPTGYKLTEAGDEVLEFAEQMEMSSSQLETRIFGRDQDVRGILRIALPPPLATNLLMPDFVDFSRLYPEVEIEILSGDEPVNLTNRQADVAIRVVYDRATLPLNLHGQKGPDIFGSVYMSRALLAAWRTGPKAPLRWVVRNTAGVSEWAHESDIATAEVPFRATDAAAQLLALQLGAGKAVLSCFVGDTDQLLVRVPGAVRHQFGTVWLLTQGEARNTKRVRLFTKFIFERLVSHGPLLQGLRPIPE